MPNTSRILISDPISGSSGDPALLSDIGDLILIMARLRAPDGCPWDREQTHESLLKNLLEEAHEFIEAVQAKDIPAMREELGDLLLQVVFHAQVAEDNGTFTFRESVRELIDKLIRRHPHVFGDVQADNAAEALNSWNSAKKQEGVTRFDSVPKAMPALMRARKLQDKAGRVGFEWASIDGALDKLDEELAELRSAIKNNETDHAGEELGDVLFVLANIGRYIGHCPEIALTGTIDKFLHRFEYIERKLAEDGMTPEDATLEQMDVYWDEAKER